MRCQQILLRDLRNIREACVSFSPGVNVLYGDNAQGKTNLLEGIYYTALGKTFRAGRDADMIRMGTEGSFIQNKFCTERDGSPDRSQELTFRILKGQGGARTCRAVEYNGGRLTGMTQVVGMFRVVLFCPAHLSIVQGPPEDRRELLNIAISQLRPLYMTGLKRFNRALRERNALLRQAREMGTRPDDTIELWSEQLAVCCADIAAKRASYILRLERIMKECFSDMTGEREVPGLEYQNSLGLEASAMLDVRDTRGKYLALLTGELSREVAAGSTLFGIHRDDVQILLNDRPARLYGSQGQQRSLALAMKLAEGTISGEEEHGEMPVFLFDDVLSELDRHRREYLLRELTGRQVIMTSCEDISRDVAGEDVKAIRVEDGNYIEV